jgi:hypothetical protein
MMNLALSSWLNIYDCENETNHGFTHLVLGNNEYAQIQQKKTCAL